MSRSKNIFNLQQYYLVGDQLQMAMDELLEAIRIDRAYENDVGVKGMVNILNMIDDEKEQIKQYRKKMIALMST